MTEEKKEKESPEGILKAEKDVEIPTKFKKLVEEIEKMSVLDLSELVKILEERFGVSAVAPMAVSSAVPNSASVETDKEEKSVFNVELASVGDKKIEVIKLVRDITTKGLKEAKDVVDAAAEKPQMIKENVKKEEAEEMKKKLEAVGAKVVLK